MKTDPPGALPESLLVMAREANRFGFSGAPAAATISTFLACDDASLIDWFTPRPGGNTFLTDISLSVVPGLVEDLVPRILARHGNGLLVQPGADGIPSYQAIWNAYVLGVKESAASPGFASGNPSIAQSVVAAWLEELPEQALGWLDAPGDSLGSGWMAKALSLGSSVVVQALVGRGIPLSATSSGKPLVLALQEFQQWEGFLASGGDPDEKGWSTEFPDIPLWEALVRERGIYRPRVLGQVAAWALKNGRPGAGEACYWHSLREGNTGGREIEARLKSRPDWRTARDYWGRPALWVAAQHEPRLWRLATDTLDREGILSAQDSFGHDAWFYAFHHLFSSTMTKKLFSELSRRIPRSARSMEECYLSQWLEDENKTTLLLEGHSWSPSSRSAMYISDEQAAYLQSWVGRLLGTDRSRHDALARSLLTRSSKGSQRLIHWLHGFEREARTARPGAACRSPLPEISPQLRMAFSLCMVTASVFKVNTEQNQGIPLGASLAAFDDDGIEWPPGMPTGPARARLVKAASALKKNSAKATVPIDHPLVVQWLQRLDAVELAQAMGAGAAPAPLRSSPRM